MYALIHSGSQDMLFIDKVSLYPTFEDATKAMGEEAEEEAAKQREIGHDDSYKAKVRAEFAYTYREPARRNGRPYLLQRWQIHEVESDAPGGTRVDGGDKYGDLCPSFTVDLAGDVAEFIYCDRDRIGIRLNGVLRYFKVQGTTVNRVRATLRYISILNGELWGYLQHADNEDAMWLAHEAHKCTKAIKCPFTSEFQSEHPELVATPDLLLV